ncbi:MAG: superoxide dismutase, Ni [Planctomycetes bacterium]|nr:superoxide dismutase, Ni [Planctomycetota bacterium]
MKILLSLAALCAFLPFSSSAPAGSASPDVSPRHCQVPCGIYGDMMRINMLMEDADTIEKAMNSLQAMDAEENPSKNQMVRWVMNKESHAQNIQDTVAAYWLAQRVKAPKEKDAAGKDKYHAQLASLHRVTVAAMKCKQTTDKAHVDALRQAALDFSDTYFSAEDLKDLEHIRSHITDDDQHHADGHK